MSKEPASVSPEREPGPASPADNQPTTPLPGPSADEYAAPAQQFPQAPTPQPGATVGGAYPQAAFSYPADQANAAEPVAKRSTGKRLALLVVGAFVIGAILFGGGFWAGSVVNSVPGISDGRFSGGDHRMGPGGGRPGDGDVPGQDDDTGSDTDGSTDTSVFVG